MDKYKKNLLESSPIINQEGDGKIRGDNVQPEAVVNIIKGRNWIDKEEIPRLDDRKDYVWLNRILNEEIDPNYVESISVMSEKVKKG